MLQNQDTWSVETPRAVGAALRSFRKGAGLTQTELADQLGTTRQLVARLEDGDVTEQVRVLMAAFRVLGVTLKAERRDD